MVDRSVILLLIPHYNNLDGLKKSLHSISDLTPVDVLIVDDGSKEDQKPNKYILYKDYPNINRLIFIDNPQNRGIEYVLNDGLHYAENLNYDYIARLDCGDICHPERFKLQKEFLDNHPDIYLVGSWVSFFDMEGKEIFQYKPETEPQNIRDKMPIANQFSHPAVMFRTNALQYLGYYPLDKKAAEDYAYFFKFVKKYSTANIPRLLVRCEVNPKGISLQSRKKQIKMRIRIILDNFEHKLNYYYAIMRNAIIYILPYRFIETLKKWIKK